ncbi:MAG: N-glycosylase [Candidatus Aenigmarchaeota archaeon ex4484_52]|nr:MAG: N-glycosylase [Candidatus Aenigmarchaeota archaeon ex4484_52]
MNNLLDIIENLKRTETKKLVDDKIKEFKENMKKSSNEIFLELCFCILTANFNARKTIKIQKNIGNEFLTLGEVQMAKKLKKLGHRHPNIRAKYIIEARKYKNTLKEIIESFNNENKTREWLVNNIKGIGYKEASHFLRNIGYENLAIIDFHIIDILIKYELIKEPKTLTKTKYIKIEKLLKKIAKKSKLNLAELDLYLWFAETGYILK